MWDTEADKMAKTLNGAVEGGINWTWAMFQKKEDAETFLAWLNRLGWDNRGLYPPTTRDERFGVRYR